MLTLVFQLCQSLVDANDLSPITEAVDKYMSQAGRYKSSNPKLPPINVQCVDKPMFHKKEASCHFKSAKGTSLFHLKKGDQFPAMKRGGWIIIIEDIDIDITISGGGWSIHIHIDITIITVIQFRSRPRPMRLTIVLVPGRAPISGPVPVRKPVSAISAIDAVSK